MKSPFLPFLAAMSLAAAAAAEEAKKPASPRFTLICGAQMQKKTFAVDTAAKTVDGVRANVSATAIAWKTGGEAAKKNGAKKTKNGDKAAANGKGTMHELNRIEGTYRSWNEGESGETALTYTCDKAGPAKF